MLNARQATLVGQRRALEESLGTIEGIIRPMAETARREAPVPDEMQRVFSVAISYLDGLPRSLSNQEFMKEGVAKVERTAGFARLSLRRREGRENYRAAIRIYDELAAEHPGFLWIRTGMIDTFHEYSNLLEAGGDLAASDAIFRRAVAVAKGLTVNPSAGAKCYTMALSDRFQRPRVDPDAPLSRAPRRSGLCPASSRGWRPAGNPIAAICSSLSASPATALGNFPEAAAALRKSIDLKKSGDAADWFFLAAARSQNGDIEDARRCFDRAVAWMKANPNCRKRENRNWVTVLCESQDEAQRALELRVIDDRLETYLFAARAG